VIKHNEITKTELLQLIKCKKLVLEPMQNLKFTELYIESQVNDLKWKNETL